MTAHPSRPADSSLHPASRSQHISIPAVDLLRLCQLCWLPRPPEAAWLKAIARRKGPRATSALQVSASAVQVPASLGHTLQYECGLHAEHGGLRQQLALVCAQRIVCPFSQLCRLRCLRPGKVLQPDLHSSTTLSLECHQLAVRCLVLELRSMHHARPWQSCLTKHRQHTSSSGSESALEGWYSQQFSLH